jgi:hypothetical protein
MPSVWLCRTSDFDLSGLSKFGDVNVVFNKGHSTIDTEGMDRIIRRDMLPASSPGDYVVVVGPSLMVLMMALIMVERHGTVNFLTWNASRQTYAQRKFPLD